MQAGATQAFNRDNKSVLFSTLHPVSASHLGRLYIPIQIQVPRNVYEKFQTQAFPYSPARLHKASRTLA